MSTLRANTISNAAGTGPVVLTSQTAAKAKFFFNHVVPSTTDDQNVSSISDGGTGRWGVNFTNSWAAADHTILQGTSYDYLVNDRIHWEMDTAPTTSAWDIISEGATGVADYRMLCGAGLGDLA